jgi:hypothetical protein
LHLEDARSGRLYLEQLRRLVEEEVCHLEDFAHGCKSIGIWRSRSRTRCQGNRQLECSNKC